MNNIIIFFSLLWKICCAIDSEIGECRIEMTNAPTAGIYRTNDIVIESAQPAVLWAPEIIDGVHGNARQQPVERRHCFERPRSARRLSVLCISVILSSETMASILHRSDNTLWQFHLTILLAILLFIIPNELFRIKSSSQKVRWF